MANQTELKRAIFEHFEGEDLQIFLQDHFREVYKNLTPGMTKGRYIELLFNHVFPGREKELLAALEKERPNIAWSHYFPEPTPPSLEGSDELPPPPKVTNILYIFGGAILLAVVIFGVIALQNRPTTTLTTEDDSGETAVLPQDNENSEVGETAVSVSSAQTTNTDQDCPPKYNAEGDAELASMPVADIVNFYPPEGVSWPDYPNRLNPVKRIYYQDTIQIGDSITGRMLGVYPDKCMIHAYILESTEDQLVEFQLSEDGMVGQTNIIIYDDIKELTRAQAIEGSATIVLPLSDTNYLIHIMNWNFDGGKYELITSIIN